MGNLRCTLPGSHGILFRSFRMILLMFGFGRQCYLKEWGVAITVDS